jgi:hypothetical protein
MCQSNIKEAHMLTPMSITSLNQGRDLAHWHIRRLYGEPVDRDIDWSETSAEVSIPAAASAVTALPERRPFLAMLLWWRKAARLMIQRRWHGKDCEITAA